MPRPTKAEIVTFKADASLLAAMQAVPNRSEFIRSAVLAALDGACPVCHGTGVLTPNQKRHWAAFTEHHSVEQCGKCNEYRLVCARSRDRTHR